jgi:hypothetical protein
MGESLDSPFIFTLCYNLIMKKIISLILLFLITILAVTVVYFSIKRSVKASAKTAVVVTKPTGFVSGVKADLVINSVFAAGEAIPDKYGCYGENVNPDLQFSNIPVKAVSLVLIVDDSDSPLGDWVHWLVFNIDPQTTEIAENTVPTGATLGFTSFGQASYSGPCPPSSLHHYHFKLYALDKRLNLTESAKKADVLIAMKGHMLDQGELIGIYSH